MKILCSIFALLLFYNISYGQAQYSGKPIKSISDEEMFRENEGWVNTLDSNNIVLKKFDNYPLFMKVKANKSEATLDKYGRKYYKSKIRFGARFFDRSEFFELPYEFNVASEFSTKRPVFVYIENKYYIYAYDLISPTETKHIIFEFDPRTKNFESKIISNLFEVGNYPLFLMKYTSSIISTSSNLEPFDIGTDKKVDLSGDKIEMLTFHCWGEPKNIDSLKSYEVKIYTNEKGYAKISELQLKNKIYNSRPDYMYSNCTEIETMTYYSKEFELIAIPYKIIENQALIKSKDPTNYNFYEKDWKRLKELDSTRRLLYVRSFHKRSFFNSMDFKKYFLENWYKKTTSSSIDTKNKIIKRNISKLVEDIGDENKGIVSRELSDSKVSGNKSFFLRYYIDHSNGEKKFNDVVFYENTIKFGFKNKNEYYELPYKYFLCGIGSPDNDYLGPNIIFFKNIYYILVQELSNSKINTRIISYNPENNTLTNDLLPYEFDLYQYCFFNLSASHGFVLNHYDKKTLFMMESYLESGKWKTDFKYDHMLLPQIAETTHNLASKIKMDKTFPIAEPYKPVYMIDDPSKLEKDARGGGAVITTKNSYLVNEYSKIEKISDEGTFGKREKSNKIGIPTKNRSVYREIDGSEILIKDMPKVKNQGSFGFCASYALGAAIQQYLFKYEREINNTPIDINNVPSKLDISYSWLQSYMTDYPLDTTYNYLSLISDGSFGHHYDKASETYNIGRLDKNEINGFYLTNSCNNIDQKVLDHYYSLNSYSEKILSSQNFEGDLYNIFKGFLKNRNKKKTSKEISLCGYKYNFNFEIENINQALEEINIKKYEEGVKYFKDDDEILYNNYNVPYFGMFLYTLFFKCDEKMIQFPTGIRYKRQYVFDDDDKTLTKQTIINLITNERPVLFTFKIFSEADYYHTVVLCGYKKVKDPITNKTIDLFKIHNSYGESWQYLHGDGWYQADVLMQQTPREIAYLIYDFYETNTALAKRILYERFLEDKR